MVSSSPCLYSKERQRILNDYADGAAALKELETRKLGSVLMPYCLSASYEHSFMFVVCIICNQ